MAVLGSVTALLLALAPQGSAAALTPLGTSGVMQPSSVRPVDRGRSNVIAIVPGSSIARGDGVDEVIQRDRSYHAEFLAWVAPNVRKARLVLQADGAALSNCTSLHLRPGKTAAITCLVRGDTKTNGNGVSIDVVVRTSNLGTFSRTFAHVLTS